MQKQKDEQLNQQVELCPDQMNGKIDKQEGYFFEEHMSVGLPVKILRESESHVITVEMKTGDQFRGYLAEAEVICLTSLGYVINLCYCDCKDTMNVRLDNVTMTNRNGKQSQLQAVYLRGAQIRFVVIPDFFKNAPMFKRIKAQTKNKNKTVIREKGRKVRDQVIGQKKKPQ